VPTLETFVQRDANGLTLVDIEATITPTLLNQIENLGGEVVHSLAQYRAIRARLSLDRLEALAALAEVSSIRPAAEAITHKDNTSEGDLAHAADLARAAFAVDGTGIRIGVLSDSVDHLATVQASGDLPSVTVLDDAPGNSGEGTAMLEIVHDLAPGADLYFATAWNGVAPFAQNIRDLRTAGCDVIVDDVGYLGEPVFQDGPIAQAINDVVADGALYFSAAGNEGNLSDGTSSVWEGDFVGTTLPGDVPGPGNAHDFGGGTNSNAITVDPSWYISLQWSDPSGGSTNDYDLYLIRSNGNIVRTSTDIQDGNDDPLEYIPSTSNDTGRLLVVVKASGAADRFLHLNTYDGQMAFVTDGQIEGHPAAERAIAVAAVNVATASGEPFVGGAQNPVETFSSDGWRHVFYETDGTPYTPGDFLSTGGVTRTQPFLAAADGVATATPGFNPFFGTSAAAPHAAALAGLLWQASPNLSNMDVLNVMIGSALDIEAAGMDRD
jgi:hypothetical protein